MIFEQKKIQIETLSEYLSAARANLNLSLKEVAEKVKMKVKFLESLETGNFKALPADVYVNGFLRRLAELYVVDSVLLIEQFKKEKCIQQQMQKQVAEKNKKRLGNMTQHLIITPKVISLVAGVMFVALTLAYIIWQVWSINKAPSLKILEPQNNIVVTGSSVMIKGETDPGAIVTVNGENNNIFVDGKGFFQTQLGLGAGPAQILVTAKNRFDKSVSQTININGYVPEPIEGKSLELKVDFISSVTLGFAIDGGEMQTMVFSSGDSKTFSAKQKILISTSDAGATRINVNGQDLGPMGRSKEQLSNIPFIAQPETTVKE